MIHWTVTATVTARVAEILLDYAKRETVHGAFRIVEIKKYEVF